MISTKNQENLYQICLYFNQIVLIKKEFDFRFIYIVALYLL